jgi:hypothetical protein
VDTEAVLAARDEARTVQTLEVLRDVCRGETCRLDQLANRPLAVAQHLHDLQPRWLGQRADSLGHECQHLEVHTGVAELREEGAGVCAANRAG